MTSEVAQAIMAFPWESKPPLHTAVGFLISGGAVTVNLGYQVYPGAIRLMAFIRIGGMEPQLWRQHWTSKMAAVEAAENLAADAEEYITETLGLTPRQVEDLDLDDFVQHVHMRVHNELH